MINAMLAGLARVMVGGYVIKALAWVHESLDGKRSEVTALLLAVVHLLRMAEVLPEAQAKAVEQALMAILPVVLADRASKVMKTADEVVPKS